MSKALAVSVTLSFMLSGIACMSEPTSTAATGDSSSPGAADTASAALEITYWTLTRLGTEPVTVAEGRRGPHLVLHPAQKRVAGFGGCNSMTGGYTVNGDRLTFSQMAGTLMACVEGMEQEAAFHSALTRVTHWRIEGENLELLDSSLGSVAQFEARALK